MNNRILANLTSILIIIAFILAFIFSFGGASETSTSELLDRIDQLETKVQVLEGAMALNWIGDCRNESALRALYGVEPLGTVADCINERVIWQGELEQSERSQERDG